MRLLRQKPAECAILLGIEMHHEIGAAHPIELDRQHFLVSGARRQQKRAFVPQLILVGLDVLRFEKDRAASATAQLFGERHAEIMIAVDEIDAFGGKLVRHDAPL